MKTRIPAAVVFILFLFVGLAAAQWTWPGCPKCYMISYVDIPAADVTTTVNVTGFWAAGWGFICEGGGPADRVDVWYQKPDGFYAPLKQPVGSLWYALERPDVQAAYAAHCPNVNAYTGWALWITNTPPAGTTDLVLNVWRGPYFEKHHRTVTVQ